MAEHFIHPLALCIFHHQGKILVNQFHDTDENRMLFRPIGGGIELVKEATTRSSAKCRKNWAARSATFA